MKNIKWIFVLYSVLAAVAIMCIGVAVSEKSILGGIGSILLVILIMGLGFKTKAKMRANGDL